MDLEQFKSQTPACRSLGVDMEDYRVKNELLFKQLKSRKDRSLDQQIHKLHNEAFEQIDCLTCANCCKTTSPIFQQGDIERVAKSIKMKVPEFIYTYLHLDEEHDYVLNSAPCPFLGLDNKCLVYNNRPTACREYPHTNRKNMRQILPLTFKNAEVCPAVFRILERLKAE